MRRIDWKKNLPLALLQAGSMEYLRYPVHQNETEYRKLLRENHFSRAIPYHTPDFSAKREILIQ